MKALFADGLPDRFLFEVMGLNLRKALAPLVSGEDFWSLIRPLTWAEVAVDR